MQHDLWYEMKYFFCGEDVSTIVTTVAAADVAEAMERDERQPDPVTEQWKYSQSALMQTDLKPVLRVTPTAFISALAGASWSSSRRKQNRL